MDVTSLTITMSELKNDLACYSEAVKLFEHPSCTLRKGFWELWLWRIHDGTQRVEDTWFIIICSCAHADSFGRPPVRKFVSKNAKF